MIENIELLEKLKAPVRHITALAELMNTVPAEATALATCVQCSEAVPEEPIELSISDGRNLTDAGTVEEVAGYIGIVSLGPGIYNFSVEANQPATVSFRDENGEHITWFSITPGERCYRIFDLDKAAKTFDIEPDDLAFGTFANIQITRGDTEYPYTPYTAEYDEVIVSRFGKNLLSVTDVNSATDGGKKLFTGSITGNFCLSMTFNYESIDTPAASQFSVVIDGVEKHYARGSSQRHSFFISGTITDVTYRNWGRGKGTVNDIMLEVADSNKPTEFAPYVEPQTAIMNPDGSVKGITSLSPYMTITSNNPGALINAKWIVGYEPECYDSFADFDNLMSFQIDRAGESKFFGFGMCGRLNVKVMDKERIYANDFTTDKWFRIWMDDNSDLFPSFYITEAHRDEKTGEVSITAYDKLYEATKHTVSEANITAPYNVDEFLCACLEVIGVGDYQRHLDENADEFFQYIYENGANFEGTETIREVLDAIAEATQSIYYLDAYDELHFKRLGLEEEPVLIIDKSKYFTLESGNAVKLTAICSATELGDNLTASLVEPGETQYIRDNPFWDLRGDRAELVDKALAAVGGLTINPFNCSWRGNYLVEPCDKIGLVTKDNRVITTYLLNDTLVYQGGLKQTTQWGYEKTNETPSNPTTIGAIIKQTYAKVDKTNKQIELVVSETNANKSNISQLELDTDSILASVNQITQSTNEALDAVNNELSELNQKVNVAVSAEDVEIIISEKITSGTKSVETNTGFTFNEDGLTISSSESEITTTITEDGMNISKGSEAGVLIANNKGVEAINLLAREYLIIGNNSRLEDYNGNRTACFWIGG